MRYRKTYLAFLRRIEYPGITEDHYIVLDKTSWIPIIRKHSDPESESSYEIEISSGKRVLLNICYALTIHSVAARHNLPLPDLLMIDQPSQHIGTDVNKKVIGLFYELLYELAQNELRDTQIVVADEKLFEPPEALRPDFLSHRMMRDTPLIPGYREL